MGTPLCLTCFLPHDSPRCPHIILSSRPTAQPPSSPVLQHDSETQAVTSRPLAHCTRQVLHAQPYLGRPCPTTGSTVCLSGSTRRLSHVYQLSSLKRPHVQLEAQGLADCFMMATRVATPSPPVRLPLPGALAHAGLAGRAPEPCLQALACRVAAEAEPAGGAGLAGGSSGESGEWAPGWGGSPACCPPLSSLAIKQLYCCVCIPNSDSSFVEV